MPNSVTLSDHDFQLEMLNQLRVLAVEQASIHADTTAVKDHLGRLNGKVADHELKVGAMQLELAERRHQYPLTDTLVDRIRPIEDFVTSARASEKTSSTWLKFLWPVIWACIGAFVFLVLTNASNILKMHP